MSMSLFCGDGARLLPRRERRRRPSGPGAAPVWQQIETAAGPGPADRYKAQGVPRTRCWSSPPLMVMWMAPRLPSNKGAEAASAAVGAERGDAAGYAAVGRTCGARALLPPWDHYGWQRRPRSRRWPTTRLPRGSRSFAGALGEIGIGSTTWPGPLTTPDVGAAVLAGPAACRSRGKLKRRRCHLGQRETIPRTAAADDD